MSDPIDDLTRRIESQISMNRVVLNAVHTGKAQRDYRKLSFEKETGEKLV